MSALAILVRRAFLVHGFFVCVIAIMGIVPVAAAAQASGSDTASGPPLFSAVGLSDVQRSELRAASAQWRATVQPSKSSRMGANGAPTAEGMAELRSAVERQQARILGILTPAQRARFTELLAARQAATSARLAKRKPSTANRPAPAEGTRRGPVVGSGVTSPKGGAPSAEALPIKEQHGQAYLYFGQVPSNPLTGTSAPVTLAWGGVHGYIEECDWDCFPVWYDNSPNPVNFKVNGANYQLSETYTSSPYWVDYSHDLYQIDWVGSGSPPVAQGAVAFNADGYVAATGTTLYDGYNFNVVTPSAAVAVTPDGGYRRVDAGQALGQPFQVTNSGNTTATYSLSLNCSGATNCALAQSQVTVGANATATVTGYFNSGAANTSGTVTLTATHSSSIGSWQDAGSISFDVNSYAVAVTPDGAVNTHEPSQERFPSALVGSTYFTVRNNGNLAVPYTVTLSCGGDLSACRFDANGSNSITVSPAAGGTSGLSVTYEVVPLPGKQGTITATARYTTPTGTVVSDAGTYTAQVARYEVVVTAQTPAPRVDVGRRAVSFTVQNTGTTVASIRLDATCAGGAGTCTNASSGGTAQWWVDLNTGQTSTQTVYYNASNPGSTGTISLTATPTYYPSAARTATSNLTVNSYAVAVTPDGQAVRADAGTSLTQAFKVKNVGNAASTYNLVRTCSGAATNCTGNPGPVALNAGDSTVVPSVTYTAGTAGTTGTVTLQATSTNTSASFTDQGSIALTVNNYQPAVRAVANTAMVDAGTGRTHTFWVSNTGNATAQYSFTPACSGTGVAAGCTASKASASLVPNDSTSVVVTYQAQNPGSTGTVSLSASYTGNTAVTHLATATITVKSYTVEVTPKGVAVRGDSGTAKYQAFSVTSTGNMGATYTLYANCGNIATACSVSPTSVALTATGTTWATLTYTPRTPGVTGSAFLVAKNTTYGVADSGSVLLTVNRYQVAVAAAELAVRVDPGADTLRFTVSNLGNARTTFTLAATCTGSGATSCTLPGGSSVTIDSGVVAQVDVRYTGGSPGTTGSVKLTATSNGQPIASSNATTSVKVKTYSLALSPKNATKTVAPNASITHNLTLTNTGDHSTTYRLSVACTAGATCSIPASMPVDSGKAATVPLALTGHTHGARGIVKAVIRHFDGKGVLRATDSAFVDLSVRDPAATWVDIVDVNPGTAPERNLCLTIALGEASAAECGDLRIVHPLPSVRALGTMRVPTLVYNSAHVASRPVVAANVTLPANLTATASDSVIAVLRVGTQPLAQGAWPAQEWTTGARTRRIALRIDHPQPTGVLTYTLEVTTLLGGTRTSTQWPGELVAVNRDGSRFGAGWWLAGVEQLVPQGGDTLLWVGGEGSARVYRPSGVAGVWYADVVDRPDSITRSGTGPYVRHLPNRVQVHFDGQGRHVSTFSRLGYETRFRYSTDGRLDAIDLPPWKTPTCSPGVGPTAASCAGATPTYTYAFAYGADSLLTSVTSPGPTVGSLRTTTVTVVTAGSFARVSAIQDPGMSRAVTFGYAGSGDRAISSRATLRGAVMRYQFDAAGKLAAVEVDTGVATPAAVTAVRSAEGRGLPQSGIGGAAASVDTLEAITLIDGPRPDSEVLDHIRIWLDRFGAPRKTRNPVGDSTVLTRGDLRFPALVTSARSPTGFVTNASYNNRGLLTATTEVSPREPGIHATTSYGWHSTWDMVTSITAPEGEVVRFGYDADGSRTYQEDGRGSTSRVEFRYYAATDTSRGAIAKHIAAIEYPRTSLQDSTESDSLTFDAKGNLRLELSAGGGKVEHITDSIGRGTHLRTYFKDGTAERFQESSLELDLMGRVLKEVVLGPGLRVGTADSTPQQRLHVRIVRDAAGADSIIERWSESPAPNPVGTLRTTFLRNRLGLVTTERDAAQKEERREYDAAGNLTGVVTRRGHRTRMQYDALNRLAIRTADSVGYGALDWGVALIDSTTMAQPYTYPPFPLFPNSGDSLLVAAIADTLTFDPAGGIRTANNRDARVSRTYYPNGDLKSETQRIRTVKPLDAGGDIENAHVYTLTYTYDRNGRRKAVHHPSALVGQLGTTSDSTWYTYHATTGLLAGLTDPRGIGASFDYNARSELSSVRGRNASQDVWTSALGYDADGRLQSEMVQHMSGVHWRDAIYRFDQRGKLLGVTDQAQIRQETSDFKYSGLGHLTTSSYQQVARNLAGSAISRTFSSNERIRYDAFANVMGEKTTTTKQDQSNNILATYWAQDTGGTGRDFTYHSTTGRVATEVRTPTSVFLYDSAGATTFKAQPGYESSVTGQEETSRWYHDATGRLRFAEWRTSTDPKGSMTSEAVWEEFRYDALGRRILVRTWRDCHLKEIDIGGSVSDVTPTCQVGSVRRTVWDGEAELWEIQAPIDELAAEEDVVPPSDLGVESDIDKNPYYGLILYTYGTRIDQPLSLTRANLTRNVPGTSTTHEFKPFTVFLHWNQLGQPYMAEVEDGGLDRCEPMANGDTTCVAPANFLRAGWYAWQRPKFVERAWWGTLINEKHDASGVVYRRNRYLDATTGRFTQEDPIGLAGGMNLYGYAGGDPVNHSDPFGLCTDPRNPLCRFSGWGALYQAVGGPSRLPFTAPSRPSMVQLGVSGSLGAVGGNCSVSGECGGSVNLTPQYGASVDVNVRLRTAGKNEPVVSASYGMNEHLGVSVSNEGVGVSVGVGVGTPVNVSVTPPSGSTTAATSRVPAVAPDATAVRRPRPENEP